MNPEDIRARIAELERRVLDGSDDRAYCLRWIDIHHRLLEAAERRDCR